MQTTIRSNTNKYQLSYKQLEQVVIDKISKSTSEQERKNVRSALKSWHTTFHLNESSTIGDEIIGKFQQSLALYITEQKKLGIKPSTYSTRVSRIKKCQKILMSLVEDTFFPLSFSEALKSLLRKNGMSPKNLIDDHLMGELSCITLLSWLNKRRFPSTRSLSVINRIEKIFNLADKTLVNLLPPNVKSPSYRVEASSHISSKPSELCAVWTAQIQEEWTGLVTYKTSPFRPDDLGGEKFSRWTRSTSSFVGEIYYPSEEINRRMLTGFFHFATLDKENPDPKQRGLGLEESSLSLSLVTDKKSLEQYIREFRYARNGNKFNHGDLTFLQLISSLLRPTTGYVYRTYELARNLKVNLSKEEWQDICIDTRNRINIIKKDIENCKKINSSEFGFGRDPQIPIKDILSLKNPLSATNEMTKKMLADVDKFSMSSIRQAVFYRDLLLISLLQADPLRTKMFRNMQLKKNLFRKDDGSWWLSFRREDFKNRTWLNADYEVRLAPAVWHIVETYLEKYRPLLLGTRIADEVFLSAWNTAGKKNSDDHRMSRSAFWEVISKRTRQYIPNCRGIGGHSFRHIVCSSIVKNGYGFDLAARVLHDSPRTVEQNYAHVRISEMFDPYNDIFSNTWNSTTVNNSVANNPLHREEI